MSQLRFYVASGKFSIGCRLDDMLKAGAKNFVQKA
jgi:hypothetical protein